MQRDVASGGNDNKPPPRAPQHSDPATNAPRTNLVPSSPQNTRYKPESGIWSSASPACSDAAGSVSIQAHRTRELATDRSQKISGEQPANLRKAFVKRCMDPQGGGGGKG